MEPQKTRILVADDEENILSLVKDILENAGYEVVAVHNGKQAQQRFRAEHFDLLILDLMMPEMDGASLAYELKMGIRAVATPIIFISAAIQGDADGGICSKMPDTYFIAKPFSPEKLLKTIARCLAAG